MDERPPATAATSFARDWVAAWNSHDLEKILAHYSDDVVLSSPFVTALLGAPDGVVRGREALRDYFARGLDANPDLEFHLHEALTGVGSIAVRFQSVGGREAIEVMEIGDDGLIIRVTAHYAELPA